MVVILCCCCGPKGARFRPRKQESTALLCAEVLTSQAGTLRGKKGLASGYGPGNLTSNQAECKRETWQRGSLGVGRWGLTNAPHPLLKRRAE